VTEYEDRIREAIDRRMEKVDAWWLEATAKAVEAHGVDSLWDIPKAERHALMTEHAGRAREAHGRDPKWAEPVPELQAEIRAEAEVADLPPPRVERPNDPKASIPCIEAPGCSQLAISTDGMRKHIAYRHPNRSEEEISEHFVSVGADPVP
jgi:hypothetical protein